MKKRPSSPARSKGYVATLPFRSQQIDDPAANFDASVWHLPENACEYRDTGQCDTAAGVYYGSAEDDAARFCPRHFYVLHFGPNCALPARRSGGRRAYRPGIPPTRPMNETLTTTGNYEGALELAKNGYIPVAMLPGTKVPAERGWQEWPGRPLTEESIARRWKGTRNGIALLCHGLVVLDVDDANKLDLVLEKCGLKEAPICRTPRGGYHVHARARKGMELRRRIKVHGQDIDLLTGPSLSILPPHTNEAGVPYEWLTRRAPADYGITAGPAGLDPGTQATAHPDP